jgi:hypothetical protein
MGEWRYSSTVLDFGTRWKLAVRFTTLLHFTPEERAEGCRGPSVGLEAVEKRKILQCRESNPDIKSVARRYTDYYYD